MDELESVQVIGHDNFKAELATPFGKKIKLEARTLDQLKHKAYLAISRNGWKFDDCPVTVTKPKGTTFAWRKPRLEGCICGLK